MIERELEKNVGKFVESCPEQIQASRSKPMSAGKIAKLSQIRLLLSALTKMALALTAPTRKKLAFTITAKIVISAKQKAETTSQPSAPTMHKPAQQRIPE